MRYLWLFGADFAIFMAQYRYRKYAIWIHILAGLSIIGITIYTALSLKLLYPTPDYKPDGPNGVRTHHIIGITIIASCFI